MLVVVVGVVLEGAENLFATAVKKVSLELGTHKSGEKTYKT
jgi:hypothetical protein